MPEPNPPEDGTRKAPPQPTTTDAPPPAPTGVWTPADSVPVQLAIPARIGRFQIKAVLGIGTYGRVFLALDPEMGRQVAIKQPFGEGLRPEYRADFLKEARAVAAIDQHANVCPVYDVDTEGGVPYIVMRFVAGGTLKGVLEARTELPVRSAAIIARKIALGLAAAHARGVIHRDLKPANVLYDEANREALITDFGLARLASTTLASASLSRGAHGTPYYMPPEQWGSTAFGPITALADVYSLGVMLYEMLTGQTPFTGTPFELMAQHCAEAPIPPSILRVGIDNVLDTICLKALEKKPGDRFRSAKEFADALAEYLRRGTSSSQPELLEALPLDEPAEAPKPFPLPLPPRPPRANPVQPPALPKATAIPPRSSASATSLPAATLLEKEVVRCPKCKARLEIAAGRLRPVECPMCRLSFAVEAGRRAAARSAEHEPLPLPDPEPEPEPLPLPPPEPPRARPRPPRPRPEPPAEKPRGRKRLLALGCLLFVVGALTLSWFIWQDELTEWVQQYQAKPVEFIVQKELEPGADQARVYRILPGDPTLLVTNSERRDAVGAVFDAKTGHRRATLKAPTESGVILDPKQLQFRYKSGHLAVFSRDPLAKDHSGLWTYAIPDDEPAEVTPTFHRQPRRAWDVNQDQTYAVSEPHGTSIELWKVETGTTVATLTAEGATFRAVAFTPDGQSVVGLCDESRLRVWDVYTGKLDNTVRLAVRPAWEGSENGDLTFDGQLTRVTVTTGDRVGVWGMKNGEVVEPMKRLADGTPLGQKYRLRVETSGRGTFSVFHDDHTLRAKKLTVPGGNEVTSWCLNDDRTLLAASSGRKVYLWRLKYPTP